MSTLAPIAFFVYNRPEHTAITLNNLAQCPLADQTTLYIFADGPKPNANPETLEKIAATRALIKTKQWCKEVIIIEAEVNKGLAGSTIEAITQVVNKHGKIIVLEDDNLVSPHFLTYINKSLDFYEDDDKVISVQGFVFPLRKKLKQPFFIKGADTWGWATWKRGWDLYEPNAKLLLDQIKEQNLASEFDINNSYGFTSMLELQVKGIVDSWSIRWYASAFLQNKLTLYPPATLVQNIGADGSGTHKDDGGKQANKIKKFKPVVFKPVPVVENLAVKKLIEDYNNRDKRFWAKLRHWLSRNFKKAIVS